MNPYSAIELYCNARKVGPWTDVYSMGGIAYYLLSEVNPLPAIDRYSDELRPLFELKTEVSVRLSRIFMKALELNYKIVFKT